MSQLFTSSGQRTGASASASVLSMNIQGCDSGFQTGIQGNPQRGPEGRRFRIKPEEMGTPICPLHTHTHAHTHTTNSSPSFATKATLLLLLLHTGLSGKILFEERTLLGRRVGWCLQATTEDKVPSLASVQRSTVGHLSQPQCVNHE